MNKKHTSKVLANHCKSLGIDSKEFEDDFASFRTKMWEALGIQSPAFNDMINNLVNVQPMSAQTGNLFYLNPVYTGRTNSTVQNNSNYARVSVTGID